MLWGVRVKGLRVKGLGFRVWGLGFRVSGLGFGESLGPSCRALEAPRV